VPPRILDLCFKVNFSAPIALVLERSETIWERIYKVTEGLIRSLPGRIAGLYFLGNTRRYPISIPRDFTDHIPGWFMENKGRVTLINPILETLKKDGFKGMVVVIAAKLPVDIDDWLDTEVFEQILFVRMAEESFGEPYNEIDGSARIDSIMDVLENPVREVFVAGKGFAPICYEVNPADRIKISYEDSEFRLKIPPHGEKLEIHLKALSEGIPRLHMIRERGAEEIVAGKEEAAWFCKQQWQRIPEKLKPVIEAGISKGYYRCPQCDEDHKYDVLFCPYGDIVLKGIPLNTCVLFTGENYLPLSEWYAYPLGNGRKLITREGNIYDWETGEWIFSHPVSLYERIDNGVWGLYHRI